MKITFLFITFLIVQFCTAQKDYFIFFQNQSQDPFYLKYKNKLYSSTVSGYLIMPKLLTGEYKFIIGIPKLGEKEFPFYCTVAEKDLGYKIIRQESEIQLMDINALALVKPNYAVNSIAVKKDSVIKEATSKELVSNTQIPPAKNPDSIVLKEPVIVKEEKLPEIINADTAKAKENQLRKVEMQPEKTTTEPIKTKEPELGTEKKQIQNKEPEQVTIIAPEANKEVTGNSIKKIPYQILKQTDADGIEIIYVDETNGNDTIRVYIPLLTQDKLLPKNEIKKEQSPVEQIIKKELPNKEKFLDFEIKNPVKKDSLTISNSVVQDSTTRPPAVKPLILVNTDCKKIATTEDYLSLRKKVAGLDKEDEMIKTTTKAFKQRCYLTEHIRNISVLFQTDENKFLFFQNAYLFIYDTDQFKTLVAELKDPVAREKFNALIQK